MQASVQTGKPGSEYAEILSRLDPAPINIILQKYEDHLRKCAARVAGDQGTISR